jgi:adenylate cyclase
MVTFRIAITAAVMAFITALTACLTFIQLATFHAAARAAASAAMDTASANTLSRLEGEVSGLSTLVRVLSTNTALTDSDDRSEIDDAIVLFKEALRELPQTEAFYVGYDNGCWLQVRRLDVLDPTELRRLQAPPGAVYNINLVRPTSGGGLPMRRVFEDEDGNKIDQLDLWDFGYDTRTRPWYRDTMRADRALVSSPYTSFNTGTPTITLSAPLQRQQRGVIAADLRLDKFSDFL